MIRKLGLYGLAIGSAAGTAMLMYAIVGLPVSVLITAALIAHETGHALLARFSGAKTWPPIFVPLGIGAVGLTRVERLDDRFRSAVALAGPLAGLATVALLGVLSVMLSAESLILPLLILVAAEIYAATLGSDGRKFRHARSRA